MIKREIEIIVNGKLATTDDIVFQKGDGDLTLYFEIRNLPYTAKPFIKSQITMKSPVGVKITTDKISLIDDKVVFVVKKEFIDLDDKVGLHEFKISLFDIGDNKITIPTLKFNVLDTLGWEVTQLVSLTDIDGFYLVDSEGYRLVSLDTI